MKVNGIPYRSLWLDSDGWTVCLIDQTCLPHAFVIARAQSPADMARAIVTMQVRGAPLIGVAGAYGLALALHHDPSDQSLHSSASHRVARTSFQKEH